MWKAKREAFKKYAFDGGVELSSEINSKSLFNKKYLPVIFHLAGFASALFALSELSALYPLIIIKYGMTAMLAANTPILFVMMYFFSLLKIDYHSYKTYKKLEYFYHLDKKIRRRLNGDHNILAAADMIKANYKRANSFSFSKMLSLYKENPKYLITLLFVGAGFAAGFIFFIPSVSISTTLIECMTLAFLMPYLVNIFTDFFGRYSHERWLKKKELERIINTDNYEERVEFENRAAKYAEELKQVMWKVQPLKAELILLAPFYMLQYQIRILLAKLSLIVPIEFSVVEFFIWRIILAIGSYVLVRGTMPLLISNEAAGGASLATYLSGLPFGMGASISALGFALSLEAFLGIFLLVLFLDLLSTPVLSKNYLITQAKNNIEDVDNIGKVLIKAWSPINRMDNLEKEGISSINYFAYKYKKYGIVAAYKIVSFATLAAIAITVFTSPFISLFIAAVAAVIYINRNNEFWANFYSQQLLSSSKSSWSLFVLAGEIGLMVYFGSYIPVISLIVKAFEINALSWGNDVVTTVEQQMGTSFSGKVYHHLGGEESLNRWWNEVYEERLEIQKEVIKSSGIVSPLTFGKENLLGEINTEDILDDREGSLELKSEDHSGDEKKYDIFSINEDDTLEEKALKMLISEAQKNDPIAKEELKEVVRNFNDVELSKQYSDAYKVYAITGLGDKVFEGDSERAIILEGLLFNADIPENLKGSSIKALTTSRDKETFIVLEKTAFESDIPDDLKQIAFFGLKESFPLLKASDADIDEFVFIPKKVVLDENSSDEVKTWVLWVLKDFAELGNQEAIDCIKILAKDLDSPKQSKRNVFYILTTTNNLDKEGKDVVNSLERIVFEKDYNLDSKKGAIDSLRYAFLYGVEPSDQVLRNIISSNTVPDELKITAVSVLIDAYKEGDNDAKVILMEFSLDIQSIALNNRVSDASITVVIEALGVLSVEGDDTAVKTLEHLAYDSSLSEEIYLTVIQALLEAGNAGNHAAQDVIDEIDPEFKDIFKDNESTDSLRQEIIKYLGLKASQGDKEAVGILNEICFVQGVSEDLVDLILTQFSPLANDGNEIAINTFKQVVFSLQFSEDTKRWAISQLDTALFIGEEKGAALDALEEIINSFEVPKPLRDNALSSLLNSAINGNEEAKEKLSKMVPLLRDIIREDGSETYLQTRSIDGLAVLSRDGNEEALDALEEIINSSEVSKQLRDYTLSSLLDSAIRWGNLEAKEKLSKMVPLLRDIIQEDAPQAFLQRQSV